MTHQSTSECANCIGIGEVMDEHGLHECRACRGTGFVSDRLTHAQIEASLQEIRERGNGLFLFVWIIAAAVILNWVLFIFHITVSK